MRHHFSRLIVAGAVLLSASTGFAGNIALTGHDDDFHQSTAAGNQLSGMLAFARAGSANSALPVLTFDQGTELTSFLTALGISWVNVNPSSAISASVFDPTKYSAIAVASDQSCGGCDNNSTGSANLAAQSGAIASFFNAGGGIVALAGASNTGYYSFLPSAATNPGVISCETCFSQTAAGLLVGIPAVNGDFPHNVFGFPGSPGMDPLWQVAEAYNSTDAPANSPFTVFISNATIGGGGFGGGGVPEPGTWSLLGAGMLALAYTARRRKVS